jgi:hypothetical protein
MEEAVRQIGLNIVENELKSTQPKESQMYFEFSKKVYQTGDKRNVEGWKILKENTTDDRVAYQNLKSGKVVLALRGTDTHNKSRAYRDIGSDALLALGQQSLSSRFSKSTAEAKRLAAKYGKDNVTVTGHSLGGSQALWISNQTGIQAHAVNPHVTYEDAMVFQNFPNATIYHSISDPVSTLSPLVRTKKTFYYYDPSMDAGLPQHGIPEDRARGFLNAVRTYNRHPYEKMAAKARKEYYGGKSKIKPKSNPKPAVVKPSVVTPPRSGFVATG